MIRKLISIACFVLAVSACGCQEQALPNSVAQMKHNSIEASQTNEESKTINTSVSSDKNGSTVIAYYFHPTMRCHTCVVIQANAARVIMDRFPQQIADGSLIWMPYDFDGPGGEDFKKEFDISASTLVLSRMTKGNHEEYKKLEKVWDLINDPAKFDEYIQTEVKQFLNE